MASLGLDVRVFQGEFLEKKTVMTALLRELAPHAGGPFFPLIIIMFK
jgi:hypothetical protein